MDRELLHEAQSALVIQDVVLHSSEIRVREDFSPFKRLSDKGLETQYKFGTTEMVRYTIDEADEKPALVEYRYQTGLRMVEPTKASADNDDVETALVKIDAVFSAIYLLVNADVRKEALDEFARDNVGFNVWPYWREYAAATLSRMRLPPVVIPFYRVQNEDEENDDSG